MGFSGLSSSHHSRPGRLYMQQQQSVQSAHVQKSRVVCFRAEPDVLLFQPGTCISTPSSAGLPDRRLLLEVSTPTTPAPCFRRVPPVASTAASSPGPRCIAQTVSGRRVPPVVCTAAASPYPGAPILTQGIANSGAVPSSPSKGLLQPSSDADVPRLEVPPSRDAPTCVPFWPSHIAYIRAEGVQFVPADFEYALLRRPTVHLVAELQALFEDSQQAQFTIFEPGLRPRQRRCHRDWLLDDFVADAVGSAAHPVRAVQLLFRPLQGYPRPQLVLTHVSAPRTFLAVPFDFRHVQGQVVTVHLPPAIPMVLVPEILSSPRHPRRALLAFQGHFCQYGMRRGYSILTFGRPLTDMNGWCRNSNDLMSTMSLGSGCLPL